MLLMIGGVAQAAVAIHVDKDAQQMTVSVDGVTKYRWPVSSGNPSHETPNGSFRTFRMEEDHYSKEFDDAPMPNSIFFTKQGHAIHGTDVVNRLGTPASHGCVRLSRANALKLWDLVKAEGLLNTTVTLTGSSQVAIARLRSRTTVARGDVDATGQPMQIAPRSQQVPAQDADAYASDQPVYYGNGAPQWPTFQQRRVYDAPRGYYQGYAQPDGYDQDARYQRPRYYGPRGYY